jgi:hypothetical protein
VLPALEQGAEEPGSGGPPGRANIGCLPATIYPISRILRLHWAPSPPPTIDGVEEDAELSTKYTWYRHQPVLNLCKTYLCFTSLSKETDNSRIKYA